MNEDATSNDEDSLDDPAVELPGELEEQIDELPPEARQQVREVITGTIRSHLPPPALLREYEDLLPGTTDRFLTLTENEAKHRHGIEEKLVDSSIEDQKSERKERRHGQNLGFWIGTILILTGGFVAWSGHGWPGALMSCGSIAGLVSIFVLGRRGESKESEAQHEESEANVHE